MKQHQYRVTVEHLADQNGNNSIYMQPIQFEVGNHDDIYSVIARARARARGDFDQNTATAFAVGLKLFSEVMLEHKENPLFNKFKPHFKEFMLTLKRGE